MTGIGQAGLLLLVAAALTWAGRRVAARLLLSRAKHRSIAGHPRWGRRLARLLPALSHEGEQFFAADGAPAAITAQRRAGFQALQQTWVERYPRTTAVSRSLAAHCADVDFTSRYRVPFQFSEYVRARLPSGVVLEAAEGCWLVDADGNRSFDLTGSYGVNLFGNDFYKRCISRGVELALPLGAVLGGLHPVVEYNVRRLCGISGLDSVSFHMSGTEAVMQAVRLARYHTGRRRLVRFCGAYHGWWGDVQPGVGNPQTERDTFTLADMSPLSLRVLETRTDIACVLVNPLQALHPNSPAPADSSLLMGAQVAAVERAAYAAWLQKVREVCTRRGIVLILDEVMMGFRLGIGGAQEFIGVRADLVTYGKTVGGGLPVGVLCGRAALMRRYREDRPADICFARGTFNGHPCVMGTMHEFLRYLETGEARGILGAAVGLWNARAEHLNMRLAEEGLPLRVAALGSVWRFQYELPSRYHWMLQYYLRAEGLALSWVGSGRMIFSLDCTEEDFLEVVGRILRAARRMRDAGWWWVPPVPAPRRVLRRRLRRELFQSAWRAWSGSISSPRKRWSGARQ